MPPQGQAGGLTEWQQENPRPLSRGWYQLMQKGRADCCAPRRLTAASESGPAWDGISLERRCYSSSSISCNNNASRLIRARSSSLPTAFV
jgi:hypothetical protein